MADLTTLQAVRAYLGIPADQTEDDALLQSLITGASASIVAWLGRDLISQPYSDKCDGTGKTRIMFPSWPVTAVASVVVNGRTIPAAAGFTGYGYRFDRTMLLLNGDCFDVGHRNVELAYTAGYATIPADVAQACIKMVAGKYKERDWVGFRSKSLAGETITFEDVETSTATRAALQNYRRVFA